MHPTASHLKRWLWIPAMAPVMYGLIRLVIWADRLHAWMYSTKYAPPTETDIIRAAIVFWGALAVPFIIGLIAAVWAFRKKSPARWPWVELLFVVLPIALIYGGFLFWPSITVFHLPLHSIPLLYSHLFVGGTLVLIFLNAGACLRQRKWGRLSLSLLAIGIGYFYLFWLYAMIIYLDT